MISLICGISKYLEMNKQNRNRLTDAGNKVVVTGEGRSSGTSEIDQVD